MAGSCAAMSARSVSRFFRNKSKFRFLRVSRARHRFPAADMSYASVSHWEDSEFLSLFRSRFLLPSLLFHGLVGLLAWQAASLVIPKSPNDAPISLQLVEVRSGSSSNKSIGPAGGPGGPKTMPKLGLPRPPPPQTGRNSTGLGESPAP